MKHSIAIACIACIGGGLPSSGSVIVLMRIKPKLPFPTFNPSEDRYERVSRNPYSSP